MGLTIGNAIGIPFKRSWSPYCTPQEYVNLGLGAFIDFSITTFYYTGTTIPTQEPGKDVNTFNPTAIDIESWLNTFVAAGMKYVIWGVKNEVGFAMWPTEFAVAGHDPYGIASTTWYSSNGNLDLTKQIVDGCHARRLKILFYFSVYDATWELWSGKTWDTHPNDCMLMIDQQLTELLTNYKGIAGIWFDDWGWRVSYAKIPFAGRNSLIKSIQPRCLVMTNDHSHLDTYGDVVVRESPNYPPADNPYLSEYAQPIRFDGHWWYSPDDNPAFIRSRSVIINRLAELQSRNSTYSLGINPDRTGNIQSRQVTLLKSLVPNTIPAILGSWQMAEGSGTTVADESANNKVLTLYNGVAWDTGNINPYSLSFDGSNDYAEALCGNLLKAVGTGDFSIQLRFKVKASGRNDLFVWKGSWVDANNMNSIDFYEDNNRITAEITIHNVTNSINAITTINLNTWYKVVFQRHDGVIMLFVDDAYKKNMASTLDLSLHTTDRVWIGSNHINFVPTADYNLNGCIEDFRIYPYAIY